MDKNKYNSELTPEIAEKRIREISDKWTNYYFYMANRIDVLKYPINSYTMEAAKADRNFLFMTAKKYHWTALHSYLVPLLTDLIKEHF